MRFKNQQVRKKKNDPPQKGIRGSQQQSRPSLEEQGRVVIGLHSVKEALKVRPRKISKVILKKGWESSHELRELAADFKSHSLKTEERSADGLDRFGSGHQGVVAILSETPALDWEKLASAPLGLVLILDGIEDPHNLGAILRTAWLAGVQAVFIPQDRAVGLTATANKVACGGAEHVPVEAVTNFTQTIEKLKELGYWVFGLSGEGKDALFNLKLPEKVVWIIGAEDKGMRTTTARLCDSLVRIPQVDAAASYNASVATAVALTESLRQRHLMGAL